MSTKGKTETKGVSTKSKEKIVDKKKKKHSDKSSNLSNPVPASSSTTSTSSTSHQHHHSAPPSHNQQGRIGLQAINENVEDFQVDNVHERKPASQTSLNQRFPRSSTVPYPAYATVRGGDPSSGLPVQYYYSDYPQFIHGTISPAQTAVYLNSSRQPFQLINNNFQPISPHHQTYSTRPVDILKPTFLIVPKEAEQKLTTKLSTSQSPIPTNQQVAKPSNKAMTKKVDKKKQTKVVTNELKTSPKVRSVEVQTGEESPAKSNVEGHVENDTKYVGILPTANPSPFVHFVQLPYGTQSPAFLHDGPPATSIIQDGYIHVDEYHPTSTSIRSMPNIALQNVSPQHHYGSSTPSQNQQSSQQVHDEQSQPKSQAQTTVTSSETTATRSVTLPQMATVSKSNTNRARQELGETDESSVASLDLGHGDPNDIAGSWRFHSLPDGRSVPIGGVSRRQRAPIPQSFLEAQHYASDSEQVTRSASYRHPTQIITQTRPFGSIPAINRPFDSIRSYQTASVSPLIRLTDKDIIKISAFYQSIGTSVYVARSIATLYTSDFDAMANLRDWKKLYIGVPMWLFNTGMNPKRNRSIRLIIAELGSSFILWDTIVNGASDVRLPKTRHITLKSLETGTILALKFDDANATDEFHQHFVKLSSDARNADLFDIFNAKRRQPVFKIRKRKVKKSAISKPTDFNHITKVDGHDRDSLYTYSVLVDDSATVS